MACLDTARLRLGETQTLETKDNDVLLLKQSRGFGEFCVLIYANEIPDNTVRKSEENPEKPW